MPANGLPAASAQLQPGTDRAPFRSIGTPPVQLEILVSKAPEALRRAKYYLDQGSDLPYSQALAFEGVPREQPRFDGVKDFADTELRNERRKLLGGFRFD